MKALDSYFTEEDPETQRLGNLSEVTQKIRMESQHLNAAKAQALPAAPQHFLGIAFLSSQQQ